MKSSLWKAPVPTITLRNHGTPNYRTWLERPTPIHTKQSPLFQSEQAVTEFSLMQLAAGGLPKRKRRKYRNHEKTYYKKNMRQVTTPSVDYVLKAHGHWVEYSQFSITNCIYKLSIIHTNHIQI